MSAIQINLSEHILKQHESVMQTNNDRLILQVFASIPCSLGNPHLGHDAWFEICCLKVTAVS